MPKTTTTDTRECSGCTYGANYPALADRFHHNAWCQTAPGTSLALIHAEAIAENARRDEIAKAVDLDAIRELWVERGSEAAADGMTATAANYRDAIDALRWETNAAEAARRFEKRAEFLLARAAELAGR